MKQKACLDGWRSTGLEIGDGVREESWNLVEGEDRQLMRMRCSSWDSWCIDFGYQCWIVQGGNPPRGDGRRNRSEAGGDKGGCQ